MGVVCDDDDPCTSDRCEPATGQCSQSPLPDGATCDDRLYCTAKDACAAGACLGTPTACPGDGTPCSTGVCNEDADRCDATAKADGDSCDDGDPCTVDGQCSTGQCLPGSAIPCEGGASGSCEVVVCDPLLGCVAKTASDGAACDDGLYCTTEDTCTAGTCSGEARDCSGIDETCRVGTCSEAIGQCVLEAQTGEPCDDGVPCTELDACDAGTCAGSFRDCSPLDSTCTAGSCQEGTGLCIGTPIAEGEACEDGKACSLTSTCKTGVCSAQTIVDCSSLDGPCRFGVCLEAGGTCAFESVTDGVSCDDGDACSTDTACSDGSCLGVTKPCQGDTPPCNTATCDSQTGECGFAPDPSSNGEPCDDGLFCTVNDSCLGGTCVPSLRDCSGAAGECEVASCDESQGCVAAGAPDDAPCSDGLACTVADQCQAGACVPGAPATCATFDGPCATGQCDESAGGCVSIAAPNEAPCNDGKNCTATDACMNGECVGVNVDCAGLTTDCAVGKCSEASGLCVGASVPDGSFCSDFVACTQGDQCAAGLCQPGVPVDCPCEDPATSSEFLGGCFELATAPDLDPIPGFTIEFWIQTTSVASARLIDNRISTAAGEADWSILYEAPGGKGQLRFQYGNTSVTDSLIGMSGVVLNDGAWHHVALVRDGQDLRWWVDGDGLPVGSATNILPLTNAAPLTVGCSRFGGESFIGRLDELVIYSYPRFRIAFEPPGRHDVTSGVVALMRFDDAAGLGLETVSGAVAPSSGALQSSVETAPLSDTCCGDGFVEEGEACDPPGISNCLTACEPATPLKRSALFDGGGGCIQLSGTNLLNVVANITVEFWVRTTGSNVILIDKRVTGGADPLGWVISLDSIGRPVFTTGVSAASAGAVAGAASVNDGNWHHLAVIYFAGSKLKWFTDGVPSDTQTVDGMEPLGNNAGMRIGCGVDGNPFSGRIDGLRVSRSLRYASAFTPSKSPIPDQNTELLYGFDLPIVSGRVRDLSAGNHVGSSNAGVSLDPSVP